MSLSELRKSVINGIGLVLVILNEVVAFVPDPWRHWVSGGIAVLVAVAHYLTANVTNDPVKAQEISAKYVPSKRAA